MKRVAVAETKEFFETLTAINLRRIWVLTLVSSALTIAIFLCNLLLIRRSGVTMLGAFDSLLSVPLLVAIALIRRRSPVASWAHWFVAGFAILWLALGDAYFFSAFTASGHNASYAIFTMACAVFLLLPPAFFFTLLGLNHAVYCGVLLAAGPMTVRGVLAPLLDGTACMALAGLASWFLFHAARENFSKERVIVERNRALAESNEELREVMAFAAHDLRSPLLDLRNLLGLARREPGAEGGTLARVLTLATDSCSAMVHLVSRLVEAHAVEAAGVDLELVPQDLRVACTAAVDRLRAGAEAKQQHIALALPPESAVARIDAPTLAQVLENLLGNALKFSPRASRVELALLKTATHWCIEVRDEGPGVPAAERAHLFKKFYRGSARPTGGEPTTGLGLHIVKTLTEAMGGRVSYVAREPGGEFSGAVFRVELPRERAST